MSRAKSTKREFKREKVKELLESEGRRTSWLANQCGINRVTLNHYLSGRTNPSLPVLKLMAIALDCDEGELWSEDEAA